MRKNLFQTLLFSVLLMLLGQCTYDRPQGLIEPRLTAERIASNVDFVELTRLANDFQDVIYNNLRDAKSEKKRVANGKRIDLLLQLRDNDDSLSMAIRLLGFKNINQYILDLKRINDLNVKLRKAGIQVEKTSPEIMAKAHVMASQKLGHIYPTIFKTSLSNSSARGGGEVCPDCHFNNCEECNDTGGGDQSIDQPGGPGGGGAYSCRANAEAQRQNAIAQAENTFILAVITCGGTGWAAGEFACGATMVTIVGAPISPGVGTGVGCFVFTTCTAFAFTDYRLKIQQAELQYQEKVAGCPR